MATYKLEIKKEFGQLHLRLFPSSEPAPAYIGPVKDLRGLLEAVGKSLDDQHVGTADTVIFRQIGYSDRTDLSEAVRTATY
ncbi:MAG: hypothetical protein EP329_12625 [Deltaproteobacteria bacterium]|nr:MAG: hypothetical protein EP329_12625 [Deltaproteobacteria bacterium]